MIAVSPFSCAGDSAQSIAQGGMGWEGWRIRGRGDFVFEEKVKEHAVSVCVCACVCD